MTSENTAQDAVTAEWNAMAGEWDDVAAPYARGLFQLMMQHHISFQGAVVMDFGCGTGLLTELIQKYAQKIIAIDPALNMIHAVQDKIMSKEWENVTAVHTTLAKGDQADQECLGNWQGKCDIIVASSVFNFVPTQDRDATMKALATFLKPGGILCHSDWPASHNQPNNQNTMDDTKALQLYDLAGVRAESTGVYTMKQGDIVFFGIARKGKSLSSFLPSWSVLFLIFCFRTLNAVTIDSFFDPDEFYQMLEPAYCLAFAPQQSCPGLTWEWTRRAPSNDALTWLERSLQGPVRTHASILSTYAYYFAIKAFHWDTPWMVSKGPLLVHAWTVAAPVDGLVWFCAKVLGDITSAKWALFASLTSWFHAYCLARTYSNSHETLLIMASIALVAPELMTKKTKYDNATLRSCISFILGGLCVAMRFTAVFAYVPMGMLLASQQISMASQARYLLVPCAICGLLGIFLCACIDRYFFGMWTLPVLGNFHFNVLLDHATLYGTHPTHWYLSAGIPAILGLLLPFVWHDLGTVVRKKQGDTGRRRLWIMTFCFITAASLNAHKEFRFMLPVLPIFCVLVGSSLSKLQGLHRKLIVIVFVSGNIFAFLYLGRFHQSGPIQVNRYIVSDVRANSHQDPISIHYLTDCSPVCRADPKVLCETDEFKASPSQFVADAYIPCQGQELELGGIGFCSGRAPRNPPDYLVTFSRYVAEIEGQVHGLGLRRVASFPHHLSIDTAGLDLVSAMRSIRNKKLRIVLEEVVLYKKIM